MFCTFHHEDTFLEAVEEVKEFVIDGEQIGIKRAKQPTNIIWENRENSFKKRMTSLCYVTTFMLVFSVLFFIVYTFYMQFRVGLSLLYEPTNVNCMTVYNTISYNELKTKATLEQQSADLGFE